MKNYSLVYKLPNFFIIGAAKCGTTSLAHYLNQHPEIYIPKEKETHFFDDNRLFDKGIDFYIENFYCKADKYPARGDATPAYFRLHEKVIPRINKLIPKESHKFIVILREPAARALSHYRDRYKTRNENLSFPEALKVENERLANNPYNWEGYFHDGLYARQLKKWFRKFGRDSFHIIFQHHFSLDTQSTLKEIFNYLNVDSSFKVPDLSRKNESGVPRSDLLMKILSRPSFISQIYSTLFPLFFRNRVRKNLILLNTKSSSDAISENDRLIKELKRRYKEDVKELEKMLNVTLPEWYNE